MDEEWTTAKSTSDNWYQQCNNLVLCGVIPTNACIEIHFAEWAVTDVVHEAAGVGEGFPDWQLDAGARI